METLGIEVTMAIYISEDGKLIQLDTKTASYQMKIDELGTLWHTYYGEKTDIEDLSYTTLLSTRGHSGNPYEIGMKDRSYSLENIPQEISGFGTGDHRSTALHVRFLNGSETLRLKADSVERMAGKYRLPMLPAAYGEADDAETLIIHLSDPEYPIRVELYYGVFEEADVITRAMRVVNTGKDPIVIQKAASLQLDLTRGQYDLITFNGRWARERIPERLPLRQGLNSVGSRRGFSGAQYNPSAILPEHDTTETQGNAYGFAFVYSGDFLLEAERDPLDSVRVQLGIHPDHFEWTLNGGTSFYTPEAMMTWSGTGISGVSLRFHSFMNEHIVQGKWKQERRPVLINNWEGTYFDFTGEKLLQIAREAAKTGVELFVLDDGWFGKRDDDRSGLGDWRPNEAKLGCTLAELGDRIRETGLRFGLWFEPETVSEDSELYRTHPDWAVRIPGKNPELSRYELLLDVSRTEVQDYLIQVMSDRIREGKLAYIKWDLNRSMSDRYTASLPAERQGEMGHRFILGVYRILETLRKEFPELLIESCASGGARFDAGMLYYTPQIWTSDDTDPIERLWIQYGTSMIYPVKAMGAHVSAVPNHQTGRVTSLRTRSVVAMSGTYGYELDATKLSDAERDEIKKEIETFKKYYNLLENGDYYRLIPPTSDSVTVWEQAAKDGNRAIVNIVIHAVRPSPLEVRFYVRGLLDEKRYRVTMVNPEDLAKLDERQKKLFGGSILTGRTLRTAGLYVPEEILRPDTATGSDYPAYQILLEATD